jgi:hypothetical protein
MHSRAPIENMKNTINTKIIQLSLSRIRATFDSEIISHKHNTIQHH